MAPWSSTSIGCLSRIGPNHLHSQKELAHWTKDVTAQIYVCCLSGWLMRSPWPLHMDWLKTQSKWMFRFIMLFFLWVSILLMQLIIIFLCLRTCDFDRWRTGKKSSWGYKIHTNCEVIDERNPNVNNNFSHIWKEITPYATKYQCCNLFKYVWNRFFEWFLFTSSF